MILTKVGKSKFNFVLLFILLSITSTFLGLNSVKAQVLNPKLIISEIMFDCAGTDADHEWVEIYNPGIDDIEITNWKFNDGSNHNLKVPTGELEIWIAPGEFLILASDRETFLTDHLNYSGQVIDTVMALNNTSDTISLLNENGLKIEEVNYLNSWGGAGNGRTLEKIDLVIDNTRSNWQESYILAGSPGEISSGFILPDYPEAVLELVNFEHALVFKVQVLRIIDGDTIEVSGLTDLPATIRLLGVDTPEFGQKLYQPAKDFTQNLLNQTIDVAISQDPSEQTDYYGRTLAAIIYDDKVVNTDLLKRGLGSYYESDNAIIKIQNWSAIALQADEENIGIWASNGGRTVILNELMPNPAGLESEQEWIEIYNPLDIEINLSYFMLDNYLIPYGTVILPKHWLVFSRIQTGIVLNNTGDKIQLFYPDGLIADTSTYSNAEENTAWTLIDDSWQWTNRSTPGAKNVISLVAVKEATKSSDDAPPPINTIPIQIKTGDFQNYLDKLIIITGKVTKTSGSTFYLDDGSGQVKVYIQEKTGILKPPMRRNDIFQITGIVDLYGATWRILPRTIKDIKLVQEAVVVKSAVKTAKAKKVAKISTSKATLPAKVNKAPPKKVLAAESIDEEEKTEKPQRVADFTQIIKLLLGLSIIFFIILTIMVLRIKKGKTVGGHFGDDFT